MLAKLIEYQINQYLNHHISVNVICFLLASLLFLCYILNDEANTKKRTKRLIVLTSVDLVVLLAHLVIVSMNLRTMQFNWLAFSLLLLVFSTPLAIAICSLFVAINKER